MNKVIEAIRKRKSVRLFETKPVPKDIINSVIESGNLAPSTGQMKLVEKAGKKEKILNYQPWRFVVIENPEFKQTLLETIEPIRDNFYESMKISMPDMYERGQKLIEMMDDPKDMVFYSAPVIIYVIGSAQNQIGCSMVCENIMIAAVSYGLGSCYVGFGAMVTQNKEITKILELEEDEKIYGPIVIGYPKEDLSEKQARIQEELSPKKKQPVIKWI
jgi:nitroreductase